MAILVVPENANVTGPILETLSSLGIEAFSLLIRESWENLSPSQLSAFFAKATHYMLVCSKLSVEAAWFVFTAGYAFGTERHVALYRADSDQLTPKYLSNLPTFDTLDQISAYYEAELTAWDTGEARRAAREELLDTGISFHMDAFAQSVSEGDIHAVSLFLKAGFGADSRNKHGVPVLSLAARNKHGTLVALLLDSGADIDAQSDDRGYSALMDAVSVGEGGLAGYLLERGANTELASKDGQTALVLAVGRNDVACARLLLEAGADPDRPDKLGLSARKYSSLFRDSDMMALFK